ncbi:MAG: hypothetical protein ABI644_13355 [Arenimonas sp.]
MRILLLAALLMLAACAAPKNAVDVKAAEPPPAMAVEEKPTSTQAGEVDFSCKTDSDCKIKDVGSCCGYRPACVNKDSETYPEQVKAECGKKGMAGICGFPSISSCSCTNSKCEGVAGPTDEGKIQ